jgi:hypothetical protein
VILFTTSDRYDTLADAVIELDGPTPHDAEGAPAAPTPPARPAGKPTTGLGLTALCSRFVASASPAAAWGPGISRAVASRRACRPRRPVSQVVGLAVALRPLDGPAVPRRRARGGRRRHRRGVGLAAFYQARARAWGSSRLSRASRG